MSMEKRHRSYALRPPSAALSRLFGAYLSSYLRRHFHAIRIANGARLNEYASPLIVYLNHASWWDPLTCMLVARRFFSSREHYAPMDAAALIRYPMLGRLGLFPVEQGTRRGAVQFLRASAEILNKPQTMLWMTPQGAFTDVRRRPVVFKPGLAALLKRKQEAIAIPLAIEYSFWDERLPEILMNVGQPQRFDSFASTDHVEEELRNAMAGAQDSLAAMAEDRDPVAFQTVLSGRAGVGLVYDGWRRLLGWTSRRGYQPEHTSFPAPTAVDEDAKHMSAGLNERRVKRP